MATNTPAGTHDTFMSDPSTLEGLLGRDHLGPNDLSDEELNLLAAHFAPYIAEHPVIDSAIDPVEWVNVKLGHYTKEAPYQEEIIRAPFTHRRTAIRAGQNMGKSYSVADAALAYFFAYDDAVVITTAPTKRQVETILWGYIRAAHTRAELAGEQLRTAVRVDDLHYMLGFATATPEQFQGIHSPHILVIVDEASGLNPVLEEAIEGMLSSEDAALILVGNPTKLAGMFYDAFHSHAALYHTIHLSAFDSPNFTLPPERIKADLEIAAHPRYDTPEHTYEDKHKAWYRVLAGPSWVEERKLLWGENSPMYQIRVLGNFPMADEFGLIPVDWLDRAVECLHLNPLLSEDEPLSLEGILNGLLRSTTDHLTVQGSNKRSIPHDHDLDPLDPKTPNFSATRALVGNDDLVASLDVARYGDNESVLYLRRGLHVVKMWTWSFASTMTSVGNVRNYLEPYLAGHDEAIALAKQFDPYSTQDYSNAPGLKTLRIDTNGVGGGVYDRLVEFADWKDIVEEFNSAWKANSDNYHDRRAEAFWQLRDLFEYGLICNLVDDRTRSQLSTLRWKPMSNNQIVIESKIDMQKRNLPSPDRADALAMLFLGVEFSPGAFVTSSQEGANRPWRQSFSNPLGGGSSAEGQRSVAKNAASSQQVGPQLTLAQEPTIQLVTVAGAHSASRHYRNVGGRP